MTDEATSDDPAHDEPVERTTRAGDVRRMADAAREATWGDTDASRSIVPGVLSGDVGPKGRVAAQLRGLSRIERGSGDVPRGTGSSGGGLLVLGVMLLVAVVLLAIVGVLGWLLG